MRVQAANTSLRRQLSEAQTKAGGTEDLTAQVTQLQAALTSALDEALSTPTVEGGKYSLYFALDSSSVV